MEATRKEILKRVDFEIATKDIAEVSGDAFLNSIGPNLEFSSSLSEVLIKIYGREVRHKCRKDMQNRNLEEPLKEATILRTEHKGKYLFHCVLKPYKKTGLKSFAKITQVIQDFCTECNELELKTLVIPLIGTGALKVPIQMCCQGIQDGIVNWLRDLKKKGKDINVEMIKVCIIDTNNIKPFKNFWDSFKDCKNFQNLPGLEPSLVENGVNIEEKKEEVKKGKSSKKSVKKILKKPKKNSMPRFMRDSDSDDSEISKDSDDSNEPPKKSVKFLKRETSSDSEDSDDSDDSDKKPSKRSSKKFSKRKHSSKSKNSTKSNTSESTSKSKKEEKAAKKRSMGRFKSIRKSDSDSD